jgi:hypothetical protein
MTGLLVQGGKRIGLLAQANNYEAYANIVYVNIVLCKA